MTRIRFAPALAAGLLTAGLALGSAAAEQQSKNPGQSPYSQTNRFANPSAVAPNAGAPAAPPVERAVRRGCVSQSLRSFSRRGSGYIDNQALFTRDSFSTYHECVRRSGLR